MKKKRKKKEKEEIEERRRNGRNEKLESIDPYILSKVAKGSFTFEILNFRFFFSLVVIPEPFSPSTPSFMSHALVLEINLKCHERKNQKHNNGSRERMSHSESLEIFGSFVSKRKHLSLPKIDGAGDVTF